MAGYLVELDLERLTDYSLKEKLSQAKAALAMDTTSEFFLKLYNLSDEQIKIVKQSLAFEIERLEEEMRRRKIT